MTVDALPVVEELDGVGGEGGQIRGDRLPTRGLKEIGVALEGEAWAVLDQDLEPRRGRRDVAEAGAQHRHRPEIAARTVGCAVAASAAAVQRRRSGARTIPVLERGFGRTVEPDPGPQVDVAGGHGPGQYRCPNRDRGRRQPAPGRPRLRDSRPPRTPVGGDHPGLASDPPDARP